MIKYFIYARKSSEGDDRQITSINDQVEECLKIAQRQGLQVVDIISESKSAKKPGRKGFNEMMARIDKGDAQGVIVLKLDRIARNPVDGGNFIWQLQQGAVKHVQTITQGFYPKDNLVVMHIEFGMAGQYSTDLGRRISIGTAKKAGRGWYPIAHLPLGYIHNTKKNISKGKPEIIKDEKRFDIIQSLWKKLLKTRCQIKELKDLADAVGLTNTNGKPLSKSAFYELFRKEFYSGYFRWKNEESENVKIQGKHIPMITPLEFRKAQGILNRKRAPVSNTTEIQKQYAGIFKCGDCSGAFTPTIVNRAYCLNCKVRFSTKNRQDCPKCKTAITKKEQFTFLYKVYYRCTKKNTRCKQAYILKEELEQQIITYLKTITINTDIYTWCIRYLEKQENIKFDKTKEQEYKKRISALEFKLKRYTDMRVEQEITKQEYLEYSAPIKKQIETLNNEREQIEYEVINWKQELENSINFAQNLAQTFVNGDVLTKRKILLQISLNTSILDKKAYFITPKHLRAVQHIAQSKNVKNNSIEHKKSLVKQGDWCEIKLPF